MTAVATTAIHATALVVNEAGLLIRGPSGVGKSRLALLLLEDAGRRGAFARLVGDDRVLVRACPGGVIAAPHPAIAGLIERRTQPFGRLAYEERCLVRLVVELHPPDAPLPRLPVDGVATVAVAGVPGVPLLRLQGPADALSCRLVMEALGSRLNAADGP